MRPILNFRMVRAGMIAAVALFPAAVAAQTSPNPGAYPAGRVAQGGLGEQIAQAAPAPDDLSQFGNLPDFVTAPERNAETQQQIVEQQKAILESLKNLQDLQAQTLVEVTKPAAAPPAPEIVKLGIDDLDTLIRDVDSRATRDGNSWRFRHRGHTVTIVADESADRMRIMAPVTDVSTLDVRRLYRLMIANYSSALDARYAINGQTVWSAYLHPLSALDKDMFVNGLDQVASLASTYGTSYTSGTASASAAN